MWNVSTLYLCFIEAQTKVPGRILVSFLSNKPLPFHINKFSREVVTSINGGLNSIKGSILSYSSCFSFCGGGISKENKVSVSCFYVLCYFHNPSDPPKEGEPGNFNNFFIPFQLPFGRLGGI
jgi:hypothetical protein